jgi:DNA repair protein RecN (Recombination protein N)
MDPAELERRLELAEHAADEIDAAAPREGEVEELRARLAVAGNAQRIVALLAETHDVLASDGRSARDNVATAVRSATELARLDPEMDGLAERIAGIEAELDDIALELRRRQETVADAATDSEVLESRLGLLYGLMRKYGEDDSLLVAYGAAARAEVQRLRSIDEQRELRSIEAERLFNTARAAAAELTVAREITARELEGSVSTFLEDLGFPHGSFTVQMDQVELDESGIDRIEFGFQPNAGEPARPLARIASGGEMSRVALAIKTVLARADDTPTLIFDEVDAGIGGRSADPVGRLLWRLARDHQVVCVTHLPQIAAYADQHLRIEKLERDGRTATQIDALDDQARRTELAHMLGGAAGAEAALAAADALLATAASARSGVSTKV